MPRSPARAGTANRTMLIHPELGTWFFLAELLTTLELAPDAPLAGSLRELHALHHRLPDRGDHRPAAARCAPLHLLPHDRAQRQHSRGVAAAHRRPHLRLRRLPHACPWNRFAQASQEGAFAARAVCPPAGRCAISSALDDDAFRALFRTSPIKRIKRRGFLRNVCVALGNVGTLDDLAGAGKQPRAIPNRSSPSTRSGRSGASSSATAAGRERDLEQSWLAVRPFAEMVS